MYNMHSRFMVDEWSISSLCSDVGVVHCKKALLGANTLRRPAQFGKPEAFVRGVHASSVLSDIFNSLYEEVPSRRVAALWMSSVVGGRRPEYVEHTAANFLNRLSESLRNNFNLSLHTYTPHVCVSWNGYIFYIFGLNPEYMIHTCIWNQVYKLELINKLTK